MFKPVVDQVSGLEVPESDVFVPLEAPPPRRVGGVGVQWCCSNIMNLVWGGGKPPVLSYDVPDDSLDNQCA